MQEADEVVRGREYPERPIVGVGAVIIHEDRVLLVRRGHAPLKGEWSVPGGALEVGETLADGVTREVLEETGLEVEPLAMVDVLDRIARDDAGRVQFHYVLVDYLCRVIGGSEAFASDAVGLRWAARDELGDVAEFTRDVILKAWGMADSL
ncbi:MAG: NUDIX hydrolase [Acidobacteriaceae bacterium]